MALFSFRFTLKCFPAIINISRQQQTLEKCKISLQLLSLALISNDFFLKTGLLSSAFCDVTKGPISPPSLTSPLTWTFPISTVHMVTFFHSFS